MAQTKLADRQAGNAPRASTKLSLKLAGGRRGEDRDVPWFGLVRVELLGNVESQEVEGEVYAEMARLKIPLNSITSDRFEMERARRTLARSFRDPEDKTRPFGSLDEFGRLDSDIILPAWHEYGDVRMRLDPVGEAVDDDEIALISAAVKKKDETLLRAFGTVKLSRWLVTTADLQSISPTPSSPNSAPESERSDSEPTTTMEPPATSEPT